MPVPLDLDATLNRVHEWIRAADQKVSIALALEAAVAALYLPSLPEWFTNPALQTYRIWVAAAVVLWICAVAAGAVALFARTKTKHGASVTFFSSIAALSLEEYTGKLKSLTPEALEADFIAQIHASAEICDRKHFWSKVTLGCFFGTLLVLMLVYLARAWSS